MSSKHPFRSGLKFILVGLIIVVLLLSMKLLSLSKKIDQLEAHSINFVTKEDYLESFNNMFDAKVEGESVSFLDDEVSDFQVKK